eukprot:353567-Karenia_brevis.AAC.1
MGAPVQAILIPCGQCMLACSSCSDLQEREVPDLSDIHQAGGPNVQSLSVAQRRHARSTSH